MSLFANPRLFSYFVIGLFIVVSLRWAVYGDWRQAVYWIAAAVINAVVVPRGE